MPRVENRQTMRWEANWSRRNSYHKKTEGVPKITPSPIQAWLTSCSAFLAYQKTERIFLKKYRREEMLGTAAGLKAKARNFASAAGRPVQPREWRKGGKEIGLEAMPRLEKWKNDGLNGNLEPPELTAN